MLFDIDGMLDRMTPEQMDRLEAYDNVHGIGLTRLMEILVNGFTMMILSWGGKDMTEDDVKKRIDPWLNRESARESR